MDWDSMQDILTILLFVAIFFFMMRGCAGMARGGGCGGGSCGTSDGSRRNTMPDRREHKPEP